MKEHITSDLIGPGQGSLFRSNDQIKTDVVDALSINDEVCAENLDVSVEQGVVTLRGSVPNEDARDEAERVAKEVLGVTEVHNELGIAG